MNNSKPPLEALRNELHNLEKRLRQIEKQNQFSRIEADFLLDQIRELYASGLDLQQAVTDQSSFPETHNQQAESHPEEIASPGQDQDENQDKHKAEDNQPDTNTRSFTSSTPEGTSKNRHSEEDKQERTNYFKQSDNTSSFKETTANTHEEANSDHEKRKEEQGKETPVEADQTNDGQGKAFSEQQPGETTTPETENTNAANQNSGDTSQNPDSVAKDQRDQSEEPSTQERHQNQRGKALHEKFEGKQTSLHEQLVANNRGKSLLDRFKNAPIDDLRYAIGLNERAKFIRELFDGQRQAYFDTIDALNTMDTYNEALQYLEHTVKPAHQWDNHQKAVEDFMELVYRRFVSSDA